MNVEGNIVLGLPDGDFLDRSDEDDAGRSFFS
jgi:hypothetical protein